MNAVWLVLIGAMILILGYRFYGAFIATRILVLDDTRKTPAVRLEDGHDYVPTNRWILFGHHFAAIAGAGPLIGPVLAAQFGFMPGLLWILLGGVLAGAVHDMVILFASVRYNGLSLAEIARKEQGRASGVIAALATIFIMILTLAGLSLTVVNSLFHSPWGAFTVGVTIPIAILMGLYLRFVVRPGKVAEASIGGVALLILGVVAGPWVAHSGLARVLTFSREQIALILPVYGFLAASLPVWLLLTPRDYLSTYMKLGVMVLLAIGVLLVHPAIHMPAFTPFVHGGGPVIPGTVWPFLFITIACGAISGFHAMISTGTTPKMIRAERDILPIGYGGMLAESFVALMALVAATSLHPADYFAINAMPDVFSKLGMHVVQLPALEKEVGELLAGRPGGAVSLAVGMAHIFASIPWLERLMAYLYHFLIVFEALFVLSTIDAGTRVGRYLLQEAGGLIWKPMANVNWMPGALLAGALMSFAWGYLVYGGTIATIWPLFGTANQLLGAMTLAIGTTLLVHMGKRRYAWVTAVPLAFMTVTTVSAGILNIVQNYLPKGNYLLAVLSAIIVILVAALLATSVQTWLRDWNRGNIRWGSKGFREEGGAVPAGAATAVEGAGR
ncbi:MAG: carbon starvation protein A [Firmicutes bacterium]|nr:carbon starvation protein A [Bacillota bacterium]